MIFRGTGAGQLYFVASLSLLSPQARGASVMSLLFQHVLKGICDEFMAIWELRLRSCQAIFTGQGHINKIIPVSEFFSSDFRKIQIFRKCSDFLKILRSLENFRTFWKFSDFRKVFRFFRKFSDFWKSVRIYWNLQNFWKCSEFLEMFRISGNFQNFQNFGNFQIFRIWSVFLSQVMSPHHSDQMSQW